MPAEPPLNLLNHTEPGCEAAFKSTGMYVEVNGKRKTASVFWVSAYILQLVLASVWFLPTFAPRPWSGSETHKEWLNGVLVVCASSALHNQGVCAKSWLTVLACAGRMAKMLLPIITAAAAHRSA